MKEDARDDQEAPEFGLRILKGTDDHLPPEQIVRERIVSVLREVFELFGYSPCETPILNYYDILASKYAGGAEILKETYSLADQGGRQLALRYDLTVPFARFVGMYQDGAIRLPFKRYEIGRVFRDGPVRTGRRREFYQCDVDMVGAPAPQPDAELLLLADLAFERLGLEVRAELNHRVLLSAVIASCGFAAERASDAILSIDKLKKIGHEGVATELREKGFPADQIDTLFARLDPEDVAGNIGLLDHFEAELGSDESARQAIAELRSMFEIFDRAQMRLDVEFTPSLARGLEIYTGTVFEFFLKDTSVVDGAVAAGGRYDKIVESFLAEVAERSGKKPPEQSFPTVGLSFGLEPLSHVFLSREPAERIQTVSDALIVPMGTEADAQRLAMDLRRRGIRVEVEYRQVRLKKSLQRCDALRIPFTIILGEDEVRQNKMALKDLQSGHQELVDIEQAAATIRARRPALAAPEDSEKG